MLQELRWRTSLSATALHAARCRAAGLPAADAQLAQALGEPSDALVRGLEAAGWPVDPVLAVLTALAPDFDGNRELVERTIARLRLRAAESTIAAWMAGAISDLEAALAQGLPELAGELPLRVGPLREQWEARGPGMLLELGRLTEEAAIPTAADLVLVAPWVGGQGTAHAPLNRVTLEALLFNPLPELPEAVRVAWLLAQLNADLPCYSDAVPQGRAAQVFALAMLPPALAAAEAVDLGGCTEPALAHALAAWRLRDAATAPAVATQLWNWWQAWLEHPESWSVAAAALDQMLPPDGA